MSVAVEQPAARRVELSEPHAFANGLAIAMAFDRLTIGDAMDLARAGEAALDPAVAGAFAAKHGRGVDIDGKTFAIVDADITDSLSSEPGVAAGVAFVQTRAFAETKPSQGEIFPEKPITSGEETVYRLKHPVQAEYKVGADVREFTVEWLSFMPRRYGDIWKFVANFIESDPRTSLDFFLLFAKLVNMPEAYPLPDGALTEAIVRKFDVADAERAVTLLAPRFIRTGGA